MFPLSEALPSLNAPTSDKMSLSSLHDGVVDDVVRYFSDYSAKLTVPQSASLTAPEVALQPVTQGEPRRLRRLHATPERKC